MVGTAQGDVFQAGLRALEQLIKLPKRRKKKYINKIKLKKYGRLFIKTCHKPVKVKTESDLSALQEGIENGALAGSQG